MSHWSDPAVVVAVIGAATALFYTILTGFIWYATWQNTRATRIILEATQRPYIGITNIEIVRPEFLTGEAKIAATIANVGTVPSRRIEVGFRVTYPDGTTGEMNEESPRLITLFQGQTFAASFGLPPEHQHLLTNGDFEVLATVRYQGMTDKEYRTYGTYKCNGILAGFSVMSGHFE